MIVNTSVLYSCDPKLDYYETSALIWQRDAIGESKVDESRQNFQKVTCQPTGLWFPNPLRMKCIGI